MAERMIFRKDARMGWRVWFALLAASATLALGVTLTSRVHLGVDGPEGAWATSRYRCGAIHASGRRYCSKGRTRPERKRCM